MGSSRNIYQQNIMEISNYCQICSRTKDCIKSLNASVALI